METVNDEDACKLFRAMRDAANPGRAASAAEIATRWLGWVNVKGLRMSGEGRQSIEEALRGL